MLKFNENEKLKKLEWTNPDHLGLDYIVPFPGKSTLGYLEKKIAFEGCEDRGCRILMTFENKEFFFNKTLEEVYNKVEKKITIDVSDIEEVKEKRKNACKSLLITIYLDFTFKGNKNIDKKRSCEAKKWKDEKEEYAGGKLLYDEENVMDAGMGLAENTKESGIKRWNST